MLLTGLDFLLRCLSKLATIPRSDDGSSCPSFVRTLKKNSLKSSFSSAGGISAISVRVSPFFEGTLSTKQRLVSFSSLCSVFQ